MTREEAIFALEYYKLHFADRVAVEAFDMAIQALSRSKIPNTCGDAISRQAVLDIINFEDKWLLDAKSHNADTKIAFSSIKAKISEMPPVTPQQRTGRWIEVIDEIDSFGDKTWHYECSICGNRDSGWGTYKHCPKCGAKMEEVEKPSKWIGAEVLDKIRAEIDEQYDRVHPYDISCAEGLEMALGIIDKYKPESEDKDGND